MRLAMLMTWAMFGFAGALYGQEPPPLLLPAPRPMPETAKGPAQTEKTVAAPQQTKEPGKTEKAVPAPPQPKDGAKADKKVPEPPQPKEPGKADNAEAPPEGKEAAKTEEAAPRPQQGPEPLMPPNPAFVDPRGLTWTQHRLPPPDKPCLEIACQMRMCLGDHRCLRERICDCLFHWPCPSQLCLGKCCPNNP
jgi:hypothetical protein